MILLTLQMTDCESYHRGIPSVNILIMRSCFFWHCRWRIGIRIYRWLKHFYHSLRIVILEMYDFYAPYYHYNLWYSVNSVCQQFYAFWLAWGENINNCADWSRTLILAQSPNNKLLKRLTACCSVIGRERNRVRGHARVFRSGSPMHLAGNCHSSFEHIEQRATL
jgi:hypothetical protein